MGAIYTETYKGCEIRIFPEGSTALNPRKEFDTFGTLVCLSRNCELSDRNMEMTQEGLKKLSKRSDIIDIPLIFWAIDSVFKKVTNQPCFNSLLFVEKEKVRHEFSVKIITPEILEKTMTRLQGELDMFNCYLQGEVYGYQTKDEDGNDIDSCWGYYGYQRRDWDHMLEEARSSIDYHQARKIETTFREYLGM